MLALHWLRVLVSHVVFSCSEYSDLGGAFGLIDNHLGSTVLIIYGYGPLMPGAKSFGRDPVLYTS